MSGRAGSRGSPDMLDGGPSNTSSSRSGAGTSLGPSSSAGAGLGAAAGHHQRAATPAGGVDAREQLLRLQEAFRSSVEKDVSCLREVLVQYKEHIERLEIQKKVLLNQVGGWVGVRGAG